MEPIVAATWGLVAVTGILATIGLLQMRTAAAEARATRELETKQLGVLQAQAEALNATSAANTATADASKAMAIASQATSVATESLAAATQAMARELLEDRKASNPLLIAVELVGPPTPQMFTARLVSKSHVVIVVERVEVFLGQGPTVGEGEPVVSRPQGNRYLEDGELMQVSEQFSSAPADQPVGDLLVFRVTGRPANGVMQSRDFYYRVTSERIVEALSLPDVPIGFSRAT